jgi:O-antigen ligase
MPDAGPGPAGRGRLPAGAPAALAGAMAGVMHFGGALKSAPLLAGLPFDLTLAAAAAAAPLLALLLASRRWWIAPLLGPPLLAAALLMLWLVLAGAWSPAGDILAAKLPELAVVGPLMLATGLLVGADRGARRLLVAVTLLAGPLVAGSVALGLRDGTVVLGGLAGLQGEQVRVQYQLAGLAIACAAALAAVKAAEAARPAPRLAWAALTACLAAAVLLPGGRAALLALALAVALAPAAGFAAAGRGRAMLLWIAGTALLGGGALGGLLLAGEAVEGLRTLERLTGSGLEASGRPALWAAALRWAGETLPFGLGTGAFPLAAGFGERRGMYPHNHALEALAEGGLPGLLLWLGAFGGGLAVVLLRLRRVSPGRGARIVALVLPVAVSVMVSTDLGNRMAWFALGLALSLAVRSRLPSAQGPASAPDLAPAAHARG